MKTLFKFHEAGRVGPCCPVDRVCQDCCVVCVGSFGWLGVSKWKMSNYKEKCLRNYEGWNFNSGNYLFTTDTK